MTPGSPVHGSQPTMPDWPACSKRPGAPVGRRPDPSTPTWPHQLHAAAAAAIVCCGSVLSFVDPSVDVPYDGELALDLASA